MTEQAASSRLGTPIQQFKGSRNIIAVIFSILFFSVIGFLLLAMAFTPEFQPDGGINVMLVVLGGISVFVVGAVLHQWWTNRGLYIQVYNNGLARVKGTQSEEILWHEVRAVWQNITKNYQYFIYTGTTYIYTVQTDDNRVLRFGNEIKGIDKLGALIQSEVNMRVFPEIVAAYNAGQTVPFGQFAVSMEGIACKDKYLSWAEIEGAETNNGYITFRKQGKRFHWANVPVSDIPNVFAFLSLVDHVVGLKPER